MGDAVARQAATLQIGVGHDRGRLQQLTERPAQAIGTRLIERQSVCQRKHLMAAALPRHGFGQRQREAADAAQPRTGLAREQIVEQAHQVIAAG